MIPPRPQLGGRFRARSPAELGERARQRIHTWLDLFSFGARGREPSDALLRRVLKGRAVPQTRVPATFGERTASAFAALEEGPGVGRLVRSRFPRAAARVLARADRAVADRFDIFGHEGLSYGDPIDWHLDPLRGRRAPLVHWSRVPYLDVERLGDHKVIWELNRHQHLVTLGQAYCLTGDERYPATVVRHLNEWMDANPPKLGINWSSSLELAFRVISWTWALHLVRSSNELSPAFTARVLKFLYLHARHIAAHLSTYFSPNTHLTGEALGLLYVGTCFDDFLEASRWRDLGWSILEAELERQVRPDGTYFEQTTWYQRYTADFYLHALRLREHAGKTVPGHVRRRVSQVVDPLVYFTGPDGATPLIGDDDGGQLLPLSISAPNDFRATLAHAAIALGRADCAALAGDAIECLPWLAGQPGLSTFDALEPQAPTEPCRLFRDGGYFVARDRWSADADFMVVDCGPHGSLSCGHAHADALSVELTLAGVPILVDPGTYSYAQPERDAFRTTLAHNTIIVDGLPSSEPDRPFRWNTAANCAILRAATAEQFAYFEGEHDGYMRLADPVRHRRAVFAVFGEFVALLDTIEARSTHTVEGRLHFDPRLVLAVAPENARISVSLADEPARALAEIVILGEGVTIGTEIGRVAPIYAVAVDAPVGTFTSRGTGSRSFWTVICSRRRSTDAPAVESVRVDSAHAVVIRTSDEEQLLVSAAATWSFDGVASDARWTWIRRAAGQRGAEEFVLVEASQLTVAGVQLLSLASRRQHVRGRRLEGGWELHVSPT